MYGASILGHQKATHSDAATLCPWVKRLACPDARLSSPSPLSAVSKDSSHAFDPGRALFRAQIGDAAT